MTRILNMTGRQLRIIDPADRDTTLMVLPSDGNSPTVRHRDEGMTSINATTPGWRGVTVIPVSCKGRATHAFLPPYREDTFLVVTRMVQQTVGDLFPERDDILTPGRNVRRAGVPYGCLGLIASGATARRLLKR
jgi:hypothetical protein